MRPAKGRSVSERTRKDRAWALKIGFIPHQFFCLALLYPLENRHKLMVSEHGHPQVCTSSVRERNNGCYLEEFDPTRRTASSQRLT